MASESFAIGHSKVFLKGGVLPKLKLLKEVFCVQCAVKVQAYYRAQVARRRVAKLRTARKVAAEAAEKAAKKAAEEMARLAAEAAKRTEAERAVQAETERLAAEKLAVQARRV